MGRVVRARPTGAWGCSFPLNPNASASVERVCDSPLSCPRGHLLTAGHVLAGWHPCGCPTATGGGHRTWTCVRCMDAGVPADEGTIYATRHDRSSPESGPQLGPDLGTHSQHTRGAQE